MSIIDTLSGALGPNPLKQAGSYASYAISAATAVRAGWVRGRGSKWMPDKTAVPTMYTALTVPLVAVLCGLAYVFLRQPERFAVLAATTGALFIVAVVALLWLNYLIKLRGIPYLEQGWFGREVRTVRIGGTVLRQEAQDDADTNNLNNEELLERAHGRIYLVFTAESIAWLHLRIQILYLLFEVFGPLSLFGVGLLLQTSAS